MDNNTLSRYDHEAFARHYELTESHRTNDRDVDFYLRYYEEKKGLIVDLGCGTGRLTIPLAIAGKSIVGVDAAEAMLSLAREKAVWAGQKIEFICCDAVKYEQEVAAAYAFMGYNTLAFIEESRVIEFANSLKRLIKKGGSFIFDLKDSSLSKLDGRPYRKLPWSGFYVIPQMDGLKLRRQIEQLFIREKRVVLTKYHWQLIHPKGQMEEVTTEMTFSVNSIEWYVKQFQRAGFELGLHVNEDPQHYVEMLC